MRSECMNHRFVYDAPLQVERLVRDVADKHQRATHSYVRRPYGVGLLLGGVDRTGPHLFVTSPDGNFYEYRAFAQGVRSQSAKTYLERNFERFGDCACDRDAPAAPAPRPRITRAHLPPCPSPCPRHSVTRDELLREAAKALHQSLEPEKELTPANVCFGIVGVDEKFTVIEGDAVASIIAGLGAAAAPGAVAAEAAAEEQEGGGAGPAVPANAMDIA